MLFKNIYKENIEMKKKVVNLNEADVKKIVRESLKKTILEVIRERKKLNECGGGGGYGGCGGIYTNSDWGGCGGHFGYRGCGMGQSHC